MGFGVTVKRVKDEVIVVYYGFPKRNSNKNDPVTIERSGSDELDAAIAELEKRGYELIKRGIRNDVNVEYQQSRSEYLTANLNSRRKQTLRPIDTVKQFAIMQRKKV